MGVQFVVDFVFVLAVCPHQILKCNDCRTGFSGCGIELLGSGGVRCGLRVTDGRSFGIDGDGIRHDEIDQLTTVLCKEIHAILETGGQTIHLFFRQDIGTHPVCKLSVVMTLHVVAERRAVIAVLLKIEVIVGLGCDDNGIGFRLARFFLCDGQRADAGRDLDLDKPVVVIRTENLILMQMTADVDLRADGTLAAEDDQIVTAVRADGHGGRCTLLKIGIGGPDRELCTVDQRQIYAGRNVDDLAVNDRFLNFGCGFGAFVRFCGIGIGTEQCGDGILCGCIVTGRNEDDIFAHDPDLCGIQHAHLTGHISDKDIAHALTHVKAGLEQRLYLSGSSRGFCLYNVDLEGKLS